jgi:O-antigen ligase
MYFAKMIGCFMKEEMDMTENKLIKYLIISIIVFSASFYYGAYAAGILAFFVLFKKDPKHMMHLAVKDKIMCFIAAALLLSTIFSKVPGYSIFIGAIILGHFLVYIVIVRCINHENIEDIFRLLNLMAVLICLYGIYQYFTGDLNVNRSWTDQGTYGSLTRIYSTMRNPNMFAAYLTFNICYAAAYFVKKNGELYTAINIMLSSLCLILTYSRGGFFAFVIAMAVIAVLCKELKVVAYLTIMVLLYYGYNFLESTHRTDLSTLAFDSSSLYRFEIWKASWSLFKENMAFGSGLGSISKLLSYSSDKLSGFIAHAHNLILHLLAETGIFGLTAFAAFVLSGIRQFILFWKEHKYSEHAYIAVGFIAALSAMLIHGIVDCAVLIPTRSMIFLIYLALVPALYQRVYGKYDT